MPLILTTPPAAEPASLAEAKAHLRVTHADDDVYISRLISAARRAVEGATGLRLMPQNWSLFADRWPDDPSLSLQTAPVSSITDIITYGEDDTPATVDPAHYYLDHASRPARAVLRDGRPPPHGGRPVNAIEVRFTAGFAAAADVPEDLRQAILLTVAHWFDHRGDGEGGALPLAANELIRALRIMRLT
jgi:uncharacterized phiE125 gp8 family phage protein